MVSCHSSYVPFFCTRTMSTVSLLCACVAPCHAVHRCVLCCAFVALVRVLRCHVLVSLLCLSLLLLLPLLLLFGCYCARIPNFSGTFMMPSTRSGNTEPRRTASVVTSPEGRDLSRSWLSGCWALARSNALETPSVPRASNSSTARSEHAGSQEKFVRRPLASSDRISFSVGDSEASLMLSLDTGMSMRRSGLMGRVAAFSPISSAKSLRTSSCSSRTLP
mmetsp:Transcript_24520/g.68339  ORF Transcript_24520/g.68339 Transcript_24520/m.68339 type:complete len:220 (-) Transcript_24520:562-1221(-)